MVSTMSLQSLGKQLNLSVPDFWMLRREQEDGHAVKNWISRLKKVLHDANDLFDNFVAEDLRDKVGGNGKISRKACKFFSSSNPIVFRYNMASEIESIQKKINEVASDMSKLNLHQEGRVFKENVSEWRKTSSFVEDSEIVGREEDKEHIINLLMQTSDNPNISLIAIVGVGGLGKTALAQLVYNDAQVQKFFAKHMWVCVSEDFHVETLLKKILKSLDNNIVDQLELEQLQKELRQSLNSQRYLLVLDDVWNKNYEKWNHLRRYLMCGASGSKILVTTRLEEVAKTMSVGTQYPLGGLSKIQSLALFKKLAFGENEKTVNPNLLSIGEQIVCKCGGVPLAIRALGSLLRTKNGEDQWSRILDGDVWRSSEDTKRVMAVLKLSYKHLPIELRQCFSYCSLYPKDWKIRKKELVQLWMAQGYLECSTKMECMEDVGNDYVKILLMRSFFQDVEMDKSGDIKCFKMHDLMHDLAMLVAGTDCYLHGESGRTIGIPTHLSIVEAPVIPLYLMDANRLRTIIWSSMWCYEPLKGSLPIILSCKSLRVLKLCNLTIKKLPKSIGSLRHLRYLDLSNNAKLRRLPQSICNLVHLQTLKLNECSKLEFFSSITELISLRYLEGERWMPTGLRKLTSLQILKNFVVEKDPKFARLNELKELNNLRGKLQIHDLGLIEDAGLESKDVNLKEKKYLQSLKFNWGYVNKNNDSFILLENLHPPQNLKELELVEYPGVRYPNWIRSLTNIVSISLYRCPHIPRLDHLPLLKHLRAGCRSDDVWCRSDNVWCEYMSCFSSSSLAKPIPTPFFPSLETLELRYCSQKEYVFLPPFPRLSSLLVEECWELSCILMFPHLEHLNMSREAKPNPYLIANDLFHSSFFAHLSTLKHLEIYNRDPVSIHQLPEEWMQNLISLEHLSIAPFHAHMFRSMRHLPAALKKLTIDFLDAPDFFEEDKTQEQLLHCLRSLQRIEVQLCLSMRKLPEWIWNNPSLGEMIIHKCLNLRSLPKGMDCLTNLQSLYIWDANSKLSRRCQRRRGADWHKIAHIPCIRVNGQKI